MARRFFKPRLVNGRAGDPALYVELLGLGRALLFDLGRLDRLKPAELLRVTHAFVSHAHVDHFFGFDHLLRLRVGHERHLKVFGPEGFLANVEGKLRGYTWNLVAGQPFVLEAVEVLGSTLVHRRFPCADGFAPAGDPISTDAGDGILVDDAAFSVRCTALDHRIPSLAFRVSEPERINVDAEALGALDVHPGSWIGTLKDAVARRLPESTPIEAGGTIHTLGALQSRLVRTTPGETLAYVADAGYTPENAAKIVALARDADILYCEGGFLHEDAPKAHDDRHLTAHEAGRLAREAGVKTFVTFHFSQKYTGRFPELAAEARMAFEGDESPAGPETDGNCQSA